MLKDDNHQNQVAARVFSPSRLQLARKRRGITKVTLSKACGLSVKSLGDFESGRAAPANVEPIADALKFPVPFFFRGELEEPPVNGVSFRALKSMTAGQRDAALAAGALAFELAGWLDARFELNQVDLPDLRDYSPEEAAIALRTMWGLGNLPAGNMVHLLESKGVRVFSLAERSRNVDAYSLWFHKQPFVFLNTMKTVEHSRMDAAHELGHLVLHRHGARHGRDDESDAKTFGSAFLMPEDSVRGVVKGPLMGPSFHQLGQLKRFWGVSMIALARRLNQLGFLSDWSYRKICIELSKYGRTREPNGLQERETSMVLAKALSLLKETGGSKSGIAKDLDLYTEDLDDLIFGLGVTSITGGIRSEDSAATERRRRFTVHRS